MKDDKRKDYICWDDYFMGISLLSAQRSKDPSTQVGACIVNKENRILSVGYNGFPIGCSDDDFSWKRNKDESKENSWTKYPFVCHAELNAILNCKGKNLEAAKIYVALFPCNECAKAIIQSGIKEVIYLSDKYAHTDSVKASKMMFDSAKIQYRQLIPSQKEIIIKLDAEKI